MSSHSWAGVTAGSLIPCCHAKFFGPELLFPRVHVCAPTAFILTASGCWW